MSIIGNPLILGGAGSAETCTVGLDFSSYSSGFYAVYYTAVIDGEITPQVLCIDNAWCGSQVLGDLTKCVYTVSEFWEDKFSAITIPDVMCGTLLTIICEMEYSSSASAFSFTTSNNCPYSDTNLIRRNGSVVVQASKTANDNVTATFNVEVGDY